MSDTGNYISRKAAIEAVCKCCLANGNCGHTCKEVTALQSIPAADVRPNVRGKWIDHQEGRWIYAKCSECGTVHDVRSNFCPNCGADMRSRED